MTGNPRPRPTWAELAAEVVVLAVLVTVPVWALGWWTALPFATAFGGVVGGRWLRWYWAPVAGFAAAALVWTTELGLLPAGPRLRLAHALGPAEGLSATTFILIGPVLIGLVAALFATGAAGAVRLATEWKNAPEPPVAVAPSEPGPTR